MTHTPGPWTAKDRMVLAQAFDGEEKAIVDRVRGGSPQEANANTRLIVAAPELLRLLKDAVRFLPLDDDTVRGFVDDARAVIAKAEGPS